MANEKHLGLIKQGVLALNSWRKKNPDAIIDLRGAYLTEANLIEANLADADLRGVRLIQANLTRAIMRGAKVAHANLSGADLTEADLTRADLSESNLSEAILYETDLSSTNLTGVNLDNTDFEQTGIHETIFNNTKLSETKNLDACYHYGPSCLDARTLLQSGKMPLDFLRGCGLSDSFIEYIPSLFQNQPTQFLSCFISHSTKDQEFADRLYNDLQVRGVRCWYAPKAMKGGEKLYDQIDTAIRVHDKLLLVLSENSLNSEWVSTEMRRCRNAEKKEGQRKLFPLRLVEMETLHDWECFDADYGKDLAVEVREYFIPDFSNWKDHDSYKKAFERLLWDLRGNETKKGKQSLDWEFDSSS